MTVVTWVLVPLLICSMADVCTAQEPCIPDDEACPGGIEENVLELVPAAGSECARPGELVVIELWQRDLQQLVSGYQATLRFDPAQVQVVSIDCENDVYAKPILCRWDWDAPGTIDLARGIDDDFQDPTDADARLATITLLVDGNAQDACDGLGNAEKLCFREHQPPTRFTDPDGHAVYPCMKHGYFDIDGTAPKITCPDDEQHQCNADNIPPPDFAGGSVSDNCDANPIVEWVGDEGNGGAGCPDNPLIITRTYRATDCAGNSRDCQQIFTVMDNTAPEITCPGDVQVQCVGDVPLPDFAGGEASDNCLLDRVEHVGDSDNGGSGCRNDPLIITRTYRAYDHCGNPADCVHIITVVDSMAPQITDGPADTEYECADDVPPCDPSLATAIDNCDDNPQVTCSSEDNGGAGCANDPLIITCTYVATDFCGNQSDPWVQTITVIDTMAPQITDGPADTEYQCADEVPPCDPSLATAVDNCDDNPQVTCSCEDNGGAGCADDPLIITCTYVATDFCGNQSQPWVQTIRVIDTTAPQVTEGPADAEYQCADEVPPGELGDVTVGDDCDPNPTVECWDESNNGAGCADDPLIITRRWLATDFCGNASDPWVQTITVIDSIAPEFAVDCPLPLIKVFPNVGECSALVNLPAPAAADNCDDDVLVEGFRDDGLPVGDPFPIGDTTVWWLATDDCGNTAICWQVIQVEPDNLLEIYVELRGVLDSPLQRCINLKVWNCAFDEPAESLEAMILFTAQSEPPDIHFSAGTAQLRVPACEDGNPLLYECMTAQDLLHTLRSTVEFTGDNIVWYDDVDGTMRSKYLVEFKDPWADGGNWLVGGNFDTCLNPDEQYVDILDFGVYSSQFGQKYRDGLPVDEPPINGHTPCPACDYFAHADANGDGKVDTIDFSFFTRNFWRRNQANCCGAPMGADRGPIMRISVEELRARGWDELVAGDLNNDGWLDMDDVEAFMNGARPKVVTPAGADADESEVERVAPWTP